MWRGTLPKRVPAIRARAAALMYMYEIGIG